MDKFLVVSAGMPRSGSTLLFNILREILSTIPEKILASGFGDDVLKTPADIYLVKTHDITPLEAQKASRIFFSYRDVRTVAVSTKRMFDIPITFECVQENIHRYLNAREQMAHFIEYEKLISNPVSAIGKISFNLGIHVDEKEIAARVMAITPVQNLLPYDPITLLYPNHFTNSSISDWVKMAPHDVQQRVNTEFSWWFEMCGYSL